MLMLHLRLDTIDSNGISFESAGSGLQSHVMSKPMNNLRLFVALYPTHEAARAMMKALEKLELPPHRPTPREQIHMTLQFIGDTPENELEATLESIERSAAGLGAFSLTALRLISLPEGRVARLVAAETDGPAAMMEIQRRLAHRLARNVRERAGDRFRPHLTLCRFKKPMAMPPLDHALAPLKFDVDRIVLMRSTLDPQGARHHEVATFQLSAS
jgi:2'-5' RNA ligase